jgi:hypothetical protein
MTYILVDAETRTYTTREPDDDDPWDNGDTGGEVTNVVASVTNREPDRPQSGGWDSIVRDLNVGSGDTVWAVVADYESGSTFGRSGGYATVLDVFDNEPDATELAYAAEYGTAEEGRPSKGTFTVNGVEYYRTWNGYFETLQSMDVWEITVQGGDGNKYIPEGVTKKYGK